MILDEIVQRRREQLAREKQERPLGMLLEELDAAPRTPLDFGGALTGERLAVIAEVKKASPSKGLICPDFHPVTVAMQYEAAGANALSVLTEEYYFQGNSRYLQEIRKKINLPILRKDFLFDSYQIYEAKLLGADAVLLIAALLDTDTLREFCRLADSLGMQCLTEVHDETELQRVLEVGCSIIGINNRNLKTFQVDLATTSRLAELVREASPGKLVSESGIKSNADMRCVGQSGADAVLIGEMLMRSGDIKGTLRALREGV